MAVYKARANKLPKLETRELHQLMLTVFQHVTEFSVPHAAIRNTVKFCNFLDLCSAELCLLPSSQHKATDELVLCDDATAKLVMIFEKLQGADAILENGHTQFVENFIECWVSCKL